jgi:hypothetical protein
MQLSVYTGSSVVIARRTVNYGENNNPSTRKISGVAK